MGGLGTARVWLWPDLTDGPFMAYPAAGNLHGGRHKTPERDNHFDNETSPVLHLAVEITQVRR